MRSSHATRRFIAGFVLALAVVLLPFTALFVRLAALGEILAYEAPPGSVDLHGTWFATDWRRYKLAQARANAPEVLVLGASAVQEFREAMFPGCSRAGCVYNASGAARPIRAARDVFETISAENPPVVLLLGLEVWQFDPEIQASEGGPDRQPGSDLEYAILVTRTLGPLLMQNARVRDVVLGRSAVPDRRRGLEAIVNGTGFRPDGSYAYPDSELARVSRQSASERDQGYRSLVEGSTGVFVPFDHPDPAVLRDLEDLLDIAQSRGTRVVGFTMPLGDGVADAIDRQPRMAAAFTNVRGALRGLFAARGIPFLMTDRAGDIGCSGDERWDGLHIGEVCTARLLQRIMDDPEAREALAPYTTPAHIAELIARRAGPLSLE